MLQYRKPKLQNAHSKYIHIYMHIYGRDEIGNKGWILFTYPWERDNCNYSLYSLLLTLVQRTALLWQKIWKFGKSTHNNALKIWSYKLKFFQYLFARHVTHLIIIMSLYQKFIGSHIHSMILYRNMKKVDLSLFSTFIWRLIQ